MNQPNECCAWCRFYMPEHEGEGFCNRHAPRPTLNKALDFRKDLERFATHCPIEWAEAVWPFVKSDDWCGEFSNQNTQAQETQPAPICYGSWIDPAERLPINGDEVLVVLEGPLIQLQTYWRGNFQRDAFDEYGEPCDEIETRPIFWWMPVPDPPDGPPNTSEQAGR